MKLNTENVTPERAEELSKWCLETAETLHGMASDSAQSARDWWKNEADRPEEITSDAGPRTDMLDFAEQLKAQGYEWAGVAGGLYAERDMADGKI
jgi:hypothetical protein